jgi:hypothetical protein
MGSRGQTFTGLRINVATMRGRTVATDQVPDDLVQVVSGYATVVVVSRRLTRPEKERHAHDAVNDDSAPLLGIIESPPGLDDPTVLDVSKSQEICGPQCSPLCVLVAG